MKKQSILIMMASIAISFLFFSCQDKDLTSNNQVIAKDIVNSSGDITTVEAVIDNFETDEEIVVATTKYEKNGFKIKLPQTVSDQYLYKQELEFEGEDWIKVSDPEAKVNVVWFIAKNNKNEYIGMFYYMGISTRYYAHAMYLYSDRKFTITGKFDEDGYAEEYDCNIKKGWNVMYLFAEHFEDRYTVTTKKPTDLKMDWLFEDGNYLLQNENANKSFKFTNMINKLKVPIQKEKAKRAAK
jgi:hypothetical protein